MAEKNNSLEDMDIESPTALKGVRRALHVLEYITIHPGRAVDISEGLDLSWATLHRTLQQLEQGGFLQRDPESNKYSIGSRMWFIGATYVANHRVLEISKPYLEQARSLSGVTIQLVERSGIQSVVLFSSHADEEITKATYGYHFPLHTGSKGLALLAYAGEEFIDYYVNRDLEKLTPQTLTDPVELKQTLEDVRLQGYAVTIADVQPFTGSIAAPIFDKTGNAVACISFVAKKSTIEDKKKRERILEPLISMTQSISISLGWKPGMQLPA